MIDIPKYKENVRTAIKTYIENNRDGRVMEWKWEDLDARRFSKISRCKAYRLEPRFEDDFWDLLILLSPNGHVFSAAVRALDREYVHSSEQFVQFYISKFIGGIKEYVHIQGVGPKVEQVLSDIYKEICFWTEEYQNESFFN